MSAATRPANGLGSNGFNGLDFQIGALWMCGNRLAGWVGLGLIENWVGWVGIGFFFFCGFECVEPMG
jgi:hypothetical protein